jgi:SET domain
VVQQKMKFQLQVSAQVFIIYLAVIPTKNLQLFKTERRGWGLRALHDIPEGSFLCIYAGQIMTEQEGNEASFLLAFFH